MTARSTTPTRTRLEVCEDLDHPGLGTDFPAWIGLGTTVDQARIERVLDGSHVTGREILHVGVGDSGLAQRFAGRVRHIDGVTIWEAEKRLADALPFANYTVHVANKYSPAFRAAIARCYDYVVDTAAVRHGS